MELDFSAQLNTLRGQTVAVLWYFLQDNVTPQSLFYLDNASLSVDIGNQPTPTPSPTPTNEPTPTPDGSFHWVQVLHNGSFETDESWFGTEHTYFTTSEFYGGARSMQLRPDADGFVMQTVFFPSDAVTATMDFAWKNNPADPGYDEIMILVTSEDLSTVEGSSGRFSINSTEWQSLHLTFNPAFLDTLRGRITNVLFFLDQDDADPRATFYIDNAVINIGTTGRGRVYLPLLRRDLPPTPMPTATPRPNVPTATPVPLVNGDFENGNLQGWQHDGTYPQKATSEDRQTGQFSALLGNPQLGAGVGEERVVPDGDGWIAQSIHVPASGNASLSFGYRIVSYDVMTGTQGDTIFDFMDVLINRQSHFRVGNPDRTLPTTAPYDSGWRQQTLDLAPYRGQTILLQFKLVNSRGMPALTNDKVLDANNNNTWVYIDNIRVNVRP